MTTYEKLVEGATKIKLAPPKPKYIEPILMATAEGEDSDAFQTVVRTLQRRLQDSAWTIVYKSLITLHIMIREGEVDVTIHYLSLHPNMLSCKISNSGGQYISNGGSLRTLTAYANYLTSRAKEYFGTKHDFIRETRSPVGSWSSRAAVSSLRKLSIEKGLLRHIESVQRQIDALVKCRFRESEVNNDLIVLGFRMLTTDLLSLYQTLNEGVLNILEHFFELSKVDANRAFDLYTTFTKETTKVIEFLRVAKHLERITKLRVPTIKHAQTSLTKSLKEYIDDPYFEVNRNQYLAEKQAKKDEGESGRKKDKQSRKKGNQQLQNNKSEHKKKKPSDGNRRLSQGEQLFGAQPQQEQASGQVAAGQMTPVLTGGLVLQTTGFNPFTGMGGFQTTPLAPVPEYPQQQQQQIPPPMPIATSSSPVVQNPVLNSSVSMPLQPQFSAIPSPQQQAPASNVPIPSSVSSLGYAPSQIGNIQPQDAFPRAQTTDSVPTGSLKRSSTNPFASGSTQQNATLGSNPFAQTRFASDSSTTAISFSNSPIEQPASSQWKRASLNPFTSAAPAPTQERTSIVTQQPLKPQATAGGLENLPTIPIFPETKKAAEQQQRNAMAGQELQQQKTQLMFQQQQQLQQQQLQQQQLQQQQLQQLPLQGTPTGSYNPFAQAQPSQNYGQGGGQMTQPSQTPNGTSNVYDGPNLIG